MTKAYLSGPMTGYEDFNQAAFAGARADLRAQGLTVLCPDESSRDGTFPQEEAYRPQHMRRDVEMVLGVDEVVVLPGWEHSRGARLEVAIALEIGIPVWRHGHPGGENAVVSFADHPWYTDASYRDLDVFQGQVREWSQRNFGEGNSKGFAPISGVAEEFGELSDGLVESLMTAADGLLSVIAALKVAGAIGRLHHAHLKGHQGIRHTPEEVADKKKDAVGDILVYLADYCGREGIGMSECVERAWGEVKHRDWLKNSKDGKVPDADPAEAPR